jgi:hypothetical protein
MNWQILWRWLVFLASLQLTIGSAKTAAHSPWN